MPGNWMQDVLDEQFQSLANEKESVEEERDELLEKLDLLIHDVQGLAAALVRERERNQALREANHNIARTLNGLRRMQWPATVLAGGGR